MLTADELPEGWVECSIGELCNLINGRAFKPTEWASAGLPIIRIQNLNNQDAKFNYCNMKIEGKYHVKHGDLLFAWSGTPGTSFGAHVWRGKEAVLNQHIFKVEFNETKLDKAFFRLAINQRLESLISRAQGGVGLRHVTKGTFETTTVSLPPLPEQRRIVTRIEALHARSQKARKALEAVRPLLEQFRQSVLASAFRGDLTADWRAKHPNTEPASVLLESIRQERRQKWEAADPKKKYVEPEPVDESDLPELPEGWCWASLDSLCDQNRGICYGVIQLGDHVRDGIPCLRTSDVRPLRLETHETKRISLKLSNEYHRTLLQGGEVLVNVRGTLGGVAVVPNSMKGWNVSREVAMVPTFKVNATFISQWIASPIAQRWLTKAAKGVAYTGINLADLRQLPVPIPSLDEQYCIVDSVSKSLGKISNCVESQVSTIDQIILLNQSILAKAFRGELVPQDPNDEPASVLLERIRAEREAGIEQKSVKKKQRQAKGN